MKSGAAEKRAVYIGTGAGLALFALFGLLPGSLIGGSIGIKIAGAISGLPLNSGLLPRVVVALSMLGGVIISGAVFVFCGAMIGWVTGGVVDSLPLRAYFTGRGKAKKGAGGEGRRDTE